MPKTSYKILAVIVLLLIAAGLWAQKNENTLSVTGAKVSDVCMLLSAAYDIEIEVLNGGERIVDLDIQDPTLEKALAALCQAAGLQQELIDGTYVLFEAGKPMPPPPAESLKPPGPAAPRVAQRIGAEKTRLLEAAEPFEFPDGLVGRRYSSVLAPKDAVPPYKLERLAGNLPLGLTISERIGGIEGMPEQPGKWELVLSLVDAGGNRKIFKGTIHVWRLITVGSDVTLKGFGGIQMALNMAQNFDEIRIESGTYKGTGLLIRENKSWDYGIKISGDWDKDFAKQIGETILDGEERETTILTISNAKGAVFIEDLTLVNSDDRAIYIDDRDHQLFFNNCIFSANYCRMGGGAIYIADCPGSFTNCTFSNNSSGWRGGAIRVGSRCSFTNCVFENNQAPGYFPAGGGAVEIGRSSTIGPKFTNCAFDNNWARGNGGAVEGKGIFLNCSFTDNSADDEGGAVSPQGTFTNCTFENNSAGDDGGAVCLDHHDSTFANCLFHNNYAKDCGGVFCSGSGNLTLSNCLFSDNSASSGGVLFIGGFYSSDQVHRITNCTFYHNIADEEGGAILHKKSKGKVGIINSIFYNNIAQGNPNDIQSTGLLEIDYCLINNLEGAANYGAHNITGDPRFVDPDEGDFSLRPDSPCINKGWLDRVPPARKYLDLAGKPRVVGRAIDLGAYEYQ